MTYDDRRPALSITRNVAEVLAEHVTLQMECIDRMYLNLYVPILQTEGGVAHFFREHRGHSFASSSLMRPMTERFVQRIEDFTECEGIVHISDHCEHPFRSIVIACFGPL